MLSRLVITFLPRSKHLLISWLQSPSAVILEPPKIKSDTVSTVSPSIFHEVMGLDAMIYIFWMLSFKPTSKSLSNTINYNLLRGLQGASQVVLVVKNLPAKAGDMSDAGLIPGSERSPGGGHGNPFQYSCLETPRDRGSWQATVHGIPKSQTQLKWLNTHTHEGYIIFGNLLKTL